MLIRFILLPFLIFTSFSASAALTTVPLREVWALSVDDSVIVNQTAKTAVGRVMLPNAEGVLFRATATTTSARLLGVAESALTGGKGNPWLTGALLAAGLSYEGYQWYQTTHPEMQVEYGFCDYKPLPVAGNSYTLDGCVAAITNNIESRYYMDSKYIKHFYTDVTVNKSSPILSDGHKLINFMVNYSKSDYSSDPANNYFQYIASTLSASWSGSKFVTETGTKKDPVSSDLVASTLLAALADQSSRQAFGENNQPYPLDGLFTNEDLSVDPTYSPSSDLNTETLPDYITKYNNGLLQTSDPSKPNYVTPAQYNYIKSQAEQAAAPAAGGSTSTNPLQGMEQPITQKQYDESNTKTDEAAANQIKSTDWTGVDTASKGGDSANDALDKMAKGIDPTLPVLLLPDLPKYSACRTIDLSWNGYAAVFPSSSQCIKMEEFKTNLGYFLYLLTAVGIILELLRRVD